MTKALIKKKKKRNSQYVINFSYVYKNSLHR